MRSLAVMLAAAALAAACSSGGASKSARVNELVFTRADGSHIAFGGHVAVTCEPATAGVPPVLRVLGGQRTPGGRRPFWILQVALTDLNHEHTFRFPRDDVAGYPIMFALDANRRNELSSSDEEARGRLVFSKATCDDGVKYRLEAHLGSEFFDQPGVDVARPFRVPTAMINDGGIPADNTPIAPRCNVEAPDAGPGSVLLLRIEDADG